MGRGKWREYVRPEAAHRLPDAATESDVRDGEGGELMKKKLLMRERE